MIRERIRCVRRSIANNPPFEMRRQFGTEFNAWIELASYQTETLDLKAKEKMSRESHSVFWSSFAPRLPTLHNAVSVQRPRAFLSTYFSSSYGLPIPCFKVTMVSGLIPSKTS